MVRSKPSCAAASKVLVILIVLAVVVGSFLFGVSLLLLWRFRENVKGTYLLLRCGISLFNFFFSLSFLNFCPSFLCSILDMLLQKQEK